VAGWGPDTFGIYVAHVAVLMGILALWNSIMPVVPAGIEVPSLPPDPGRDRAFLRLCLSAPSAPGFDPVWGQRSGEMSDLTPQRIVMIRSAAMQRTSPTITFVVRVLVLALLFGVAAGPAAAEPQSPTEAEAVPAPLASMPPSRSPRARSEAIHHLPAVAYNTERDEFLVVWHTEYAVGGGTRDVWGQFVRGQRPAPRRAVLDRQRDRV